MASLASVTRSLSALGSRQFWTFRTIHTIAGGLLTILGAGEAVFVNEDIRLEITRLDQQIATASERLATIDRALFQFRFAQTNALTLGILSANDSLKPEFRQSMVSLMFVTRTLPTEMMLQQIDLNDPAAFQKDRSDYLALVEAAKTATNQADWDNVGAFEFKREAALFEIEQQVLKTRDELVARRSDTQGHLSFAVTLGFVLQQLGFVAVLLAGLLYQHREGGEPMAMPGRPAH
jgi:hypothetical protein